MEHKSLGGLWAGVTAIWAAAVSYLAPHWQVFASTVPFTLIWSLWLVKMFAVIALDLGAFPERLEDGTIVRRRFQTHHITREFFRFVGLMAVLWATAALCNSALPVPGAKQLAILTWGYMTAMKLAAIWRNWGQLLGYRQMEEAGVAMEASNTSKFFPWSRKSDP